MDGFPIEISMNILSWLPVKSVLRCKSVCKTWCSIIDSPLFVDMHFNSATESEITYPSSFLLIPRECTGQLFIVEDYYAGVSPSSSSQGVCKVKFLNMHQSCLDNSFWYLVGSSHGLLCFSSRSFDIAANHYYSLYIVNLATQEHFKLPDMTLPSFESATVASGFAFHDSTKEFTAVVILSWKGHDQKWNTDVQVFTLGSNSWKKVIARIPDYLHICAGSRAYVNQSFHWLTQCFELDDHGVPIDRVDSPSPIRIVAFDLGQESFRIVPNPEFTNVPSDPSHAINSHKFIIGVLGGFLSLTDCYYQRDTYEVWVMKDYNFCGSWTKQYVISRLLISQIRICTSILPILVRKNGEIALLCNSKFLVSYNLENGTVTPLEDDELLTYQLQLERDNALIAYQTHPYVGSLISPKQHVK